MKVIIWPENISEPSKGKETKVIKLKHPVTEQDCLCIFDEEHQLYEITNFSELHSSWFIGDKVCSDGSLLITTPIDPLYFLLPYLEKNSKHFSILEDILQDSESLDNKYLISSLSNCNVSAIADSKDFSDKPVYKYNENKTLEWLKAKVTNIAKVLETNSIDVKTEGSAASNYIEIKKVSKESYLEYACELINEYISEHLYNQLKTSYGFSSVDQSSSTNKRVVDGEIDSSPKPKKSKVSTAEPDDDYSSATNGKSSVTKSNQKLSVTQKKLLKVDKTGMKNISHFFAKK